VLLVGVPSSNTINRENLDPFNEHNDETCLQALERVHLQTGTPATKKKSSNPSSDTYATVTTAGSEAASSANSATVVFEEDDESKAINLATEVSAGGNNFSQGQRQVGVPLLFFALRRY